METWANFAPTDAKLAAKSQQIKINKSFKQVSDISFDYQDFFNQLSIIDQLTAHLYYTYLYIVCRNSPPTSSTENFNPLPPPPCQEASSPLIG